jgi:hypothetical protein
LARKETAGWEQEVTVKLGQGEVTAGGGRIFQKRKISYGCL